jgi:hypothetical protein
MTSCTRNGSGRGPTEVQSPDLPGVNEENLENPRSQHRYTDQNLNRESPESEFGALTPCQPARAHKYGFNYEEVSKQVTNGSKQLYWT